MKKTIIYTVSGLFVAGIAFYNDIIIFSSNVRCSIPDRVEFIIPYFDSCHTHRRKKLELRLETISKLKKQCENKASLSELRQIKLDAIKWDIDDLYTKAALYIADILKLDGKYNAALKELERLSSHIQKADTKSLVLYYTKKSAVLSFLGKKRQAGEAASLAEHHASFSEGNELTDLALTLNATLKFNFDFPQTRQLPEMIGPGEFIRRERKKIVTKRIIKNTRLNKEDPIFAKILDGRIHLMDKYFTSAEQSYLEAEAMSKQYGCLHDKYEINYALAYIYFIQRKYTQAKEYIEKAVEDVDLLSSQFQKSNTYNLREKIQRKLERPFY